MPPSSAPSLRWIDQQWNAIGEVFPSFTMNWLYEEYGPDRLAHHQWMLTRPSYLAIAQEIHRTLTTHADILIRSVTENANFPKGQQRALALQFLRRLRQPNGAEVTVFLVATACELLGIRPFCRYEEAALHQWMMEATQEAVPHYGNVYNLLINCIAQTMLWVLGYYPYTTFRQYTALRQQKTASANVLSVRIDPSSEVENRRLLQVYCLGLNDQLQRISRQSPVH